MSGLVKPVAGKIYVVGAGPGGPEALTCRAREVLESVSTCITDPDVPAEITDLVAVKVPLPSSLLNTRRDEIDAALASGDKAEIKRVKALPPLTTAQVRTEVGEPAAIGKQLVAHARRGEDIIRLVVGNPLSQDSVVAELNTVARSAVEVEIVPGMTAVTGVPAYAGIPLGSSFVTADTSTEVNWDELVAFNKTLVLITNTTQFRKIASALTSRGLAPNTPVSLTANGSTCRQKSVDTTIELMNQAGKQFGCNVVAVVGQPVAQRRKFSWWENRALFGWHVLIPRTKEQAASMRDRIISHGATPAEVPTIAVEPPRSPAQMEKAIKGLVDGRYEWVVFTSTNAVKAVWDKFGEFGLDARAFSGVKVACVGEATASKVRALGIIPELVPKREHSSLGLLEVFGHYDSDVDPSNKVLLPRADIATETLVDGLNSMGWEAEDVTVYRTVRAAPPAPHIRQRIKTGGYDAVCFTSSSTVRNLVGIAGKPHARTLIACIGPKTAETAREFGLRVDVQPETADVIALVDALAEHANKLRSSGMLPPPKKKSRRRVAEETLTG